VWSEYVDEHGETDGCTHVFVPLYSKILKAAREYGEELG
jgi:hypothetical protein